MRLDRTDSVVVAGDDVVGVVRVTVGINDSNNREYRASLLRERRCDSFLGSTTNTAEGRAFISLIPPRFFSRLHISFWRAATSFFVKQVEGAVFLPSCSRLLSLLNGLLDGLEVGEHTAEPTDCLHSTYRSVSASSLIASCSLLLRAHEKDRAACKQIRRG